MAPSLRERMVDRPAPPPDVPLDDEIPNAAVCCRDDPVPHRPLRSCDGAHEHGSPADTVSGRGCCTPRSR
jgi:hypothetical protein